MDKMGRRATTNRAGTKKTIKFDTEMKMKMFNLLILTVRRYTQPVQYQRSYESILGVWRSSFPRKIQFRFHGWVISLKQVGLQLH
jgi:hypothetical protein